MAKCSYLIPPPPPHVKKAYNTYLRYWGTYVFPGTVTSHQENSLGIHITGVLLLVTPLSAEFEVFSLL